jgi:hypothetical protein
MEETKYQKMEKVEKVKESTEKKSKTKTKILNPLMLTTRFTTETFQENKRYRDTHNIPCIYSSSLPISDKLAYQDYYVLEMNNSTNRIMGIGKISKTLQPIAYIYSYKYYNRYTYKGIYVKIFDTESELLPEHKDIITRIERKIFYGKGHLKRGSSFTSFPVYPHEEDVANLILIFNYIIRSNLNTT